MVDEEKGLVRKILWTDNVKNLERANSAIKGLISVCHEYEIEGFGILADKNNPERIDDSSSVVLPKGEVFTPEQIVKYFIDKEGGYFFSSQNSGDVKMHKAQRYYTGFKEAQALSLET